MALKLKDGTATEGLPAIELAGERYFVPRLRLRERIAISALTPRVQAIMAKFPSKEQMEAGASVPDLSEDDYLVMVQIVRHALTSIYPGVTDDDLLDSEIDFNELFLAYPAIIEQGTSRRPPSGEALATAQTLSSGEGSSPS